MVRETKWHFTDDTQVKEERKKRRPWRQIVLRGQIKQSKEAPKDGREMQFQP